MTKNTILLLAILLMLSALFIYALPDLFYWASTVDNFSYYAAELVSTFGVFSILFFTMWLSAIHQDYLISKLNDRLPK